MKKLEAEVGPITNMPNMARGIVNRLSVGAEVQRMCVRAVESLEAMLSNASSDDPEIPCELLFAPKSLVTCIFGIWNEFDKSKLRIRKDLLIRKYWGVVWLVLYNL